MKTNFRLLTAFLFVQIIVSPAVSNAQAMLAAEGIRLVEYRNMDGTLIKSGKEMDVVGSPMLEDGWGKGTIRFMNGKIFSDTGVNLSLYTHKLYVQRSNSYIELVQPVTSFQLSFQNENQQPVTHTFKNGFPAVGDRDENDFYEVLYEGKNLQLLVWLHKKVVEHFIYNGPQQKEYELVQRMYLYKPGENKMIPLNNAWSVKSVEKSLPSYTGDILSYNSSHKIDAKNKEQFVGLVSYLDSK